MAKTCQLVASPAALQALLDGGKVVLGPYTDQAACLAVCGGSGGPPTIDAGQTSTVCLDAETWTFTGTDFTAPATSNTVQMFDADGTPIDCTVTSGTSTSLTVSLDSPPIAVEGAVTAIVSNSNGTSSEVQVGTADTCVASWYDTFTDSDGTTLGTHIPDTSPGGVGYTAGGGVTNWIIVGNKLALAAGTAPDNRFDPGLTSSTATIDFHLLITAFNGDAFYLYPRANTGTLVCSITYTGSNDRWRIDCDGSAEVVLLPGNTYTITVVNSASEVSITVNGVTVTAVSGIFFGETKWRMQGAATAAIYTLDELKVVAS